MATNQLESDPRWPFKPVAMVNYGGLGEVGVMFQGSYFAVAPGGTLYDVTRNGTMVNGSWVITHQFKALSGDWSTTKELTNGYRSLLSLTATSLNQHSFGTLPNGSPDYVPGPGVPVGGRWTDVIDLAAGGRTADGTAEVYYVARTSGALDRVVIPDANPAAATTVTLLTSGFADTVELTAGFCSDLPRARVLLNVTSAGTAYARFDASVDDGSGTDITGGSRPVASGWKDSYFGN